MNLWAVLALSWTSFGVETLPGQIPDRVILEATFRGQEIGFDFVRLECMRVSKELDLPSCRLDEVILIGCDSGTAQIFPRHTPSENLEISGSLQKRQIIVEIQGAGVRTVFRFNYFPAPRSSAYILTDATMTQHDSVRKRDFEWPAVRGREATIKLPCAIKANGIWDRRELQ